jgi:outer membrane protein assembly factor BamA
MFNRIFAFFICLAFWLVIVPAGAQKFLPKSIQFNGDSEYSDQEFLSASGLKEGQVLDDSEMNVHSKRLMDTGVFDGLTFKFDGQDLIFLLTPATQLYPIELENLPLSPGQELDAKLHELFRFTTESFPAKVDYARIFAQDSSRCLRPRV